MRKLQTGITCYESLGAIGESVALKRDKIQSFRYLSYKKYLNLYPKYGQEMYIASYQKSRFYLDEYPEQKELRRNWLGDWYSKVKWLFQITDNMNRFSTMIQTTGFTNENFPDWGNSETVSGCELSDTLTITFNPDWDKDVSDGYFINRWLIRR